MFPLLFQKSCLVQKNNGANKGQQESCTLRAGGSHQTLTWSTSQSSIMTDSTSAWLQWCLTNNEAVITPTYEQYMLECLEILPISHNDFICHLSKTSTNDKNSIFYFIDKSRDIPTLGRCQFSPNLYPYSMQSNQKSTKVFCFLLCFRFFFPRNWQDVSKIFMESQRSKSTEDNLREW